MTIEKITKIIPNVKYNWGNKCLPSGNMTNPEYIIVGLNPAKGIPNGYKCWSNKNDGSSKILLPILEELGVLDKCYFTNIVKNETPDNTIPTYEMFFFWYPYFLDEIENFRYKHIIALGHTTSEFLTSHDIKHFNVWHPAYLLRRKHLLKEYINQIKKIL